MIHCGGLDLTRARADVASLRDKDEQVAMVPNELLSQEDESSLATVPSAKAEEVRMVGMTSVRRRMKSSVLSVSFELGLRTIREEYASLASVMNDYKVRVTNKENKMDEEDLSVMALV